MNSNSKDKVIGAAVTTAALIISYILCRYVFFGLHEMKDWPLILLIAGLIATLAAAVLNARRLMAFIAGGYIGGFALGMLLGTKGADPGGGATNNAWLIWATTFLLAVLAGLLLEFTKRRISKSKNEHNKLH